MHRFIFSEFQSVGRGREMPRVTVELRAIVEAVEFRSDNAICIAGEVIKVVPDGADMEATKARLTAALYQRLYCRPLQGEFGPKEDPRAAKAFVEELSRANCGRGSWEPGWVIRTLERDGTLVVRKPQNDLNLWASPTQFRPAQGDIAIGSAGRLLIGKEMREMLPGYYMALGDADPRSGDTGSPGAIVRFYWHLTAPAAVVWMGELTQRFNAGGIAFHAKVLSDPSAYLRADAGVLYVAGEDLARAMELLPGVYGVVSSRLRRTSPMFTRRLARGLAAADDPGLGQSFGQHRCQLVADALMRAFTSNRTRPYEVAASVTLRFAEAGLTIARPWLNDGSRNVYAWRATRPEPLLPDTA